MRPVDADPKIIASAADCRLTVFQTLDNASKFWIKSREFNIPHLVHETEDGSKFPEFKNGASLAIFRLAPADFHRFSSPVSGTLGAIDHIPGTYYTVRYTETKKGGVAKWCS